MAKSNRTQSQTADEGPATLPMPSVDQSPATHEEDPFLTPAAVARQIGVSPQTVGRWIQDGLITATFFPNERWKVRKSEVNRLLRGSCLDKQVV